MMRKLAFGLVLGAALVMPVAACGSGDDGDTSTGTSPESSASVTPLDVVTDAAAKTAGTSFSTLMAGADASESLTGSYDPNTESAIFDQISPEETMTVIVTADSMYFSDIAELDGMSMRLDLSKIPTDDFEVVYLDATFPLDLLRAATDATETGDGSYSGTLDLGAVQVSSILGSGGLEAAKAAAGADASAIAYTATINADGYVTEVLITLPGITDDGETPEYGATFSDFGTAVTVTLPEESQVVDAPDEIYESW